ncbi:LysR family transcriptional regulator ArgP [Microbacterium sp. SORGH_AS_0862]|uniref:LysR family transcriptional regulator ArgP n=1 Tax=Microbacterium sp. SORGH_AS_0862 TaxID=3041789 RepID=UPI002794876D|nr:LysR family transcriptional regulator ArgP [Microbacterium sp. SORGH_AS_0862]MDQ1205921.1 LysR family transcriptional regulator (chromosome initiation inhibitor) [Microbacterium sp. SORGH_AS_0862]
MMDLPADLAATLAAVVDTGTMEAAARRLHITPSAVSQRIRALEERLGRVLLVRAKPARATADGERVVRLARQYALLSHDVLQELGEGESRAAVSLSLAVNADSLSTWFVAALSRVAALHDVVFDLHRDDQDFTAELLASGRVVAAVTSRADPVAGCRVRPLGAMRYRAVATPIVARELERLGAEHTRVVDYDRRDELQTRWLRERGIDPASPPRSFVPGSHAFADAVRGGLGWGMLPDLQTGADLADGSLVLLPGSPVDVPLYWQQWNLTSSLLDAVADAVAETASRALRITPR